MQKSVLVDYKSKTISNIKIFITSVKMDKEARTHNIGIAKMQADGSRVSTVVILLGCISSLTLSNYLCAYHHLFYLYSAAVSRADGILFPALRQYPTVRM
jgi:hypothetical protein